MREHLLNLIPRQVRKRRRRSWRLRPRHLEPAGRARGETLEGLDWRHHSRARGARNRRGPSTRETVVEVER